MQESCRSQKLQLIITSTIRLKNKCGLCDVDISMDGGTRQAGLSISEKPDLLEFSHPGVSYTEWYKNIECVTDLWVETPR